MSKDQISRNYKDPSRDINTAEPRTMDSGVDIHIDR